MTIIELEAHRRTITTPQGPVSYIDVGSGPVALFVHGLGTNALLWRHVIRDLLTTAAASPLTCRCTGGPRRRQARTSA